VPEASAVHVIYRKADFSLTGDLTESISIVFGQTSSKSILLFEVTWKRHLESFQVKMCSFTACFLGDKGRGAETVFN